jgi:hypothetical protein
MDKQPSKGHTMRAKFWTKENTVYAEFDCAHTGERVSEAYTSQGYVRDKRNRQVCDDLSTQGNTLTSPANDVAALLALIRSEYRSMRRAEKIELNTGKP